MMPDFTQLITFGQQRRKTPSCFLLGSKKLFLKCVCICVSACCVFRSPWRPEEHVRARITGDYKPLVWVLGTEPRSSERATAELSLQPHGLDFNTIQDRNPGTSATQWLVPMSVNVIKLIPTVIPRSQSDLDNPSPRLPSQVVLDCLKLSI